VDDVSIAQCTTDAAGMVAHVKVTNNSSKRSMYQVDVAMEAPNGDQLASAVAFVTTLESGQSTTTDAHSLTEPPPDGQFKCRVVKVDRSEAF
jgi:hypothetical protein